MGLYSYIASGGIGNRAAAISTYVYDIQYLRLNIDLVWENNGSTLAANHPSLLWKNWKFPVVKINTNQIEDRIWYIPARAAKSEFVKTLWKELLPVDRISSELKKLPDHFDCALTIRNYNVFTESINRENLIEKMKSVGMKSVFLSSDRHCSMESWKQTLTDSGFEVFYYDDASRIHTDDRETPSAEKDISSLVDWYSLLKCNRIYKNVPRSTFTDLAEDVFDIETELV